MDKNKDEFNHAKEEWQENYRKFLSKIPERKKSFKTLSGIKVDPLYMPEKVEDNNGFMEKISFPGQYPYTRGVYPSMYRNRLWTKRQLVGFGGPENLNERTRMLLKAGQTGTNVTASGVSMRGYDTDQMADELHKGYVGLYGTPLDSVLDIEIALKDIPIDRISSNYSDQGPFVSTALHFSEAMRRGMQVSSLMGSTSHADCLSHWSSCHNYILFPLEAHMIITVDLIKWCSKNTKKWHALTITGQHHSQNGATPVQEIAFTLAAGIAYSEACINAGLDIDDFAPRIGAFFDGHINLFEMAAKLRAARRIWAKIMKERFGAKNPNSYKLSMHTQTSGVELTRQIPHLNIARVAIQALGAVLGGCNSLHADSWDEAINIPSEEAALIALMTQHVISEESGVADVIDPLGGSYYFENLTDRMEDEITKIIKIIDSMGGMLKATQKGWVFEQLTRSANEQMNAIEKKEKIMVGANEYVQPGEGKFDSPEIDTAAVERQIERTRRLKKDRDQEKASKAIDELRRVAGGDEGSIFQEVMNSVRSYCTRGEIVRCLQDVFGEPNPPCTF